MHKPETVEEYELLKTSDLIVIKFGAEWCRPCKMIANYFELLAEENLDVTFINVDTEVLKVDDGKNIRGLPTFQFYKKGKLVHSFAGANKDVLIEQVKRLQE